MRHVLKIAGILAGALVAFVAALFIYANTESGQSVVASLVEPLSGGKVAVEGLSGRLPNALRARHVELRDDKGPWLELDNVVLDWSALAMLGNHFQAQRLTASRADVLRLPESSDNQSATQVDIAMLDIPDFRTAAALTESEMRFSAIGSAHYVTLQDIAANLSLTRLDGTGTYRADGSLKNDVANGTVTVDEENGGLITGMLGLNAIGPIRANLTANGGRGNNRVAFTMDAGALHAMGSGTIDVSGQRVDVDFSANAPQMEVRPDLSWQSLAADGHAHGTLHDYAVDGMLTIGGLKVNGASAGMVTASLMGMTSSADFTASIADLQIDGIDPSLVATAPVEMRGHLAVGPQRTVTFTVTHPIVSAEGRADLGAMTKISAMIGIKRLQPFAALAGIDLSGEARFNADFAETATGSGIGLDGTIDATGGDATIARLVGRNAPLTLTAEIAGSAIAIREARLRAAAGDVRLAGSVRDRMLDVVLRASVPDVSRIASDLKGSADIEAKAQGPIDSARVSATATGKIGAGTFAPQRIHLDVTANGLRRPAMGAFKGGGNFQNAPVALSGTFAWNDRGLGLVVDRGDWKSLDVRADINLPQGGAAEGTAALHMGQIADAASFIGVAISGSLDATLDFRPRNRTTDLALNATAHGLQVQDAKAGELTIRGNVADPFGAQDLALTLNASGFQAAGFSGALAGNVGGGADAPSLKLNGNLKDQRNLPATIAANAAYDRKANAVSLTALTVGYRDIQASLATPTTVRLAGGIAVDQFTMRAGMTNLSVSGRLTPRLAANVKLENVTAGQVRQFLPDVTQGTLNASADLTGTLQAPQGTLDLNARDLRVLGMPTSIAPGTLTAKADLMGRRAAINASLVLGSSKLDINGDAPLSAGEAFNLRVAGNADLSLLNAELTAEGRTLTGTATIDAAVSGTMAAPNFTGSARIAGGDFQDFPRGLRLTDMAANAAFKGNAVQIVSLTAKAGTGTISGSGTIDLSVPGTPIDLKIAARDAQPVSSDLLRANVDADVTVIGTLSKRLLIAGKINIRRGESILPNSFPPTVASLNVVKSGQAPPSAEAAPAPATIAFDLSLASQGRFFVRGRGLDAELQGDVHLGGTIDALDVSGGFTMRRGTFDLGGQTLDFTSGKMTFEGASLRNRLDPALDFTAESVSGGVTAKLEITGTVSSPRVQLTSTPPMPQDEVLSQLLFQQSVKQLTAVQLAEMAQAAAALGGFGSGVNPLATVRRTLGLERLSVATTGPDNQTAVEAGKYVSRNVYVGAKQGLSNQTQAEVQVDITKNLKLKGTATTGTSATVTQGTQQTDLGNSVGLSYQFEY